MNGLTRNESFSEYTAPFVIDSALADSNNGYPHLRMLVTQSFSGAGGNLV